MVPDTWTLSDYKALPNYSSVSLVCTKLLEWLLNYIVEVLSGGENTECSSVL